MYATERIIEQRLDAIDAIVVESTSQAAQKHRPRKSKTLITN